MKKEVNDPNQDFGNFFGDNPNLIPVQLNQIVMDILESETVRIMLETHLSNLVQVGMPIIFTGSNTTSKVFRMKDIPTNANSNYFKFLTLDDLSIVF